ncbi:MAG: signal peptidase I [Alishewanella sp.]|uniref:signal peptidase I n=2 Tax=unclassified Alishewanella TaxID=2628974 RepID=UPI002771D814|nr:signal peptidase I [Alishewanella sp.]
MKETRNLKFVFFNLTFFTICSYMLHSYVIYFGFLYELLSAVLLMILAFMQSFAVFKKRRSLGVIYSITALMILFYSIRVGGINGYYTTYATGLSSYPTVNDGDYLMVSPMFMSVRRGVFIHFQLDDGRDFAKRLYGLPGDKIHICNNSVYVNNYHYSLANDWIGDHINEGLVCSSRNHNFTLGTDEFFVLGDNTVASIDSRHFGPIKATHIRGEIIYKYGARYGFNSFSIDESF